MRRPTVTVVVPCYNYGHYLATSVGSVLRQPGVDVEVILIDDASPDGSAAVARNLAAADRRVRTTVHRRNRGHIATYNEGLRQAQGDYVVLLSADDALTPGALERATALMEAEPSVGLVYGFPVEFDDDLPPVSSRVRRWSVWSGADWIERRCRTGRNCIMCPEVVMRSSVQHAIGGYDPALPHSGDLEMWLRAASVGDVGRVSGPAQAYYRVHANSMQRTIYAGHIVDLEGRLAAFQKVLVGPAARVPRGEELFTAARRALSTAALKLAISAHVHGRTELEPVDEYLAFAERVWPEVLQTRAWARLARRATADSGPIERRLSQISHQLADDLQNRMRWRRWRWNGV